MDSPPPTCTNMSSKIGNTAVAGTDAAIWACGWSMTEMRLPGWRDALRAVNIIIDLEGAVANAKLTRDPVSKAKLSDPVREALDEAAAVFGGGVEHSRDVFLGKNPDSNRALEFAHPREPDPVEAGDH